MNHIDFSNIINSDSGTIGNRLVLNREGTMIRIFPADSLLVVLSRVWNEERQRSGWTHSDGSFHTDEELIARYSLTDSSRVQRLEQITTTEWQAF